MPRSQQARFSFSGGVRTPRLSLRADHNPYTDRDKYSESSEILQNWVVTPQGGIQFRQGFQNIQPSSDPTQDSRIFQFHRGGEVSDVIVHVTAIDSLVHFLIDGEFIASTVTHPYLVDELEALWFTNQEKMAVILHPDHPPLYIEVQLDGTITGELMLSEAVPYMDYDDADSPAASLTATDDYTVTWVDGGTLADPIIWDDRDYTVKYNGAYASQTSGEPRTPEYYVTSSKHIAKLTDVFSSIPELTGADTDIGIVPVGTPDSTNEYTITITGPNAGKKMEMFPTNTRFDHFVRIVNTMEETETTEPAWSYPTYVLHGGVYYQCIKPNTPTLGAVDPGNEPPNAEYWTPLDEKPGTFDWQYPDGNAWTADDPTGDRKAYSPGGRGFPTVGVFYEQRLLLMANPGMPMGVFGSRIAKYKDFALGPQDDDPLFFAIDTSDSPQIKWAQAQRKLIIGTSSGDFSLQSDNTMTPSNVQATKQNAGRSHGTNAITVGIDIFYVQQGKEKMRKTSWVDDLQAQYSQDISITAQHLLVPRVKRLSLMQTPEVIISGLRDDGSLVFIAYTQETDSAAWTEILPGGDIIDVCGGYNAVTDEDELWAVTTYNNGVTRWLEKMPYPARTKELRITPSDDALVDQNIVCLDGWISGSIWEGDNNVITGLDQFNGLIVSAMVDDAYTGEYLVTDGAIVLDSPPPGDVPTYEGTYAVGFKYDGNGLTFEVFQGNPNGVGFGTKRRWNELYVRLLDSSLPKINGQLPRDRSESTEMSVAEIIRPGTQDLRVHNTGYDDGKITILQDRPYPTHILGFYGQIEVENA